MKRSPVAIVVVSVAAFFGSAAAVVAFRLSRRPAPAAASPAPLPSPSASTVVAPIAAPPPELPPLAIASASSTAHATVYSSSPGFTICSAL